MDPSGTPNEVEDLALTAFRVVRERLSLELDFTPETISILDHVLVEQAADPASPAASVLVPCAGAYFGEVVRRNLGAFRWHCPSDDYAGWRLEGEEKFLFFNPIGVALERVLGEAVDGYHAHLGLYPDDRVKVQRVLEGLGPVREDDYYRLGVRLEVLEAALRAVDGSKPRDLSAAAYARVADAG